MIREVNVEKERVMNRFFSIPFLICWVITSLLTGTYGFAEDSEAETTTELTPLSEEVDNVADPESLQEPTEEKGPYRLRIGDRLYITVYGEPNTNRVVEVDYTGSISYLLVDSVFALGKTIDELRQELDVGIRKYFKHAIVTITPVQFGGQYYTILGQVNNPGKKILQQKTTLLEALCSAGGFSMGSFRSQTTELADLGHAFVAREGDYVPVDFRRLVIDGDLSENIDIETGDYIFIPNSLYKEVYILGELNAPTTIGYLNTVTVIDAIAEARGLTPRASSRAIVIRGSLANPTRYEVDLNRILKGKEKDFVLQPGDIFFVPPFKFTNLKDVVKAGIRAFVGAAASVAGSRTWQNVHPHSRGEDVTPAIVVP